jgi:signal transduction histidine kinase
MDGFRDVALGDIVREVGDLYEPIAEDKNVDFAVRAEANTTVHGDRDLLFEAIANLVDNAVKFTPQGGRGIVQQQIETMALEDVRNVLAQANVDLPKGTLNSPAAELHA